MAYKSLDLAGIPLQTTTPLEMGQWGIPEIPALSSPGAAVPAQLSEPPGWFNIKSAFGDATTKGWAPAAIGGLSALANAYLGMQQYGIAKQTLAENKRQFNLNFDAQSKSVNSQLADRQAARVASNPGAYQSVSDYMGQYGIKG